MCAAKQLRIEASRRQRQRMNFRRAPELCLSRANGEKERIETIKLAMKMRRWHEDAENINKTIIFIIERRRRKVYRNDVARPTKRQK